MKKIEKKEKMKYLDKIIPKTPTDGALLVGAAVCTPVSAVYCIKKFCDYINDSEMDETKKRLIQEIKENNSFQGKISLCKKIKTQIDLSKDEKFNTLVNQIECDTLLGWAEDFYQKGEYRDARNKIILAMDIQCNDEKHNNFILDKYNHYTEALVGSFCNGNSFTQQVTYEDRQFILFVRDANHIAGCVDTEGIIKYIFTQGKYPKDLIFTTGRPQPNTLYICHPQKTDTYLPFENADDYLFDERVRELCKLSQCLGATEVVFRTIHGKDVREEKNTRYGGGISGHYEDKSASINYERKANNSSNNSSKNSKERIETYRPTQEPYCPDDLIWLESEPEWKDIVYKRMEGNILNYTINVSSSTKTHISKSESHQLKAAFDAIIAKAEGTLDIEKKSIFKSEEESILQLTITFADKDKIASNQTDPSLIKRLFDWFGN